MTSGYPIGRAAARYAEMMPSGGAWMPGEEHVQVIVCEYLGTRLSAERAAQASLSETLLPHCPRPGLSTRLEPGATGNARGATLSTSRLSLLDRTEEAGTYPVAD